MKIATTNIDDTNQHGGSGRAIDGGASKTRPGIIPAATPEDGIIIDAEKTDLINPDNKDISRESDII